MGFHDVYVKDIYYVINDRFPSGFIIQTVTLAYALSSPMLVSHQSCCLSLILESVAKT